MARGHLPIPFPPLYFRDLSERTRFELERNFQAIEQAINGITSGVSYFDATVTPGVTDDETARVFSTVYAAMDYLINTLGYKDPFIGVYSDTDRDATTNAGPVETTNFTLGGGAPSGVQVTVVGMSGRIGTEMEMSPAVQQVEWDLADTTCSATGFVNLVNLRLVRNTGTKAYLLGSGTTAALQCDANYFHCRVSGGHVGAGIELPDVFGYRSEFSRINNFEGNLYLDSCQVSSNRTGAATITLGTSTTGQAVFCRSTVFVPNSSGTITWEFAGDTVTLIDCPFSFNSWTGAGAGAAAQITFAGAVDRVYIENMYALNNVGRVDLITTSATIAMLRVTGSFNSVDLGPLASDIAHDLDIVIESTSTIDGPAIGKVYGRGTDARLILTGANNNLQVSLLGDGSGSPLLDMQNVDDSIITFVARNTAASSTTAPYSFDSSCARNVLIFEKDNITWGAPINLGTSCLVIDHDGTAPSGTAGGDLSGTYPNPTVDGLQTRAVASTAPSGGQALVWNSGSSQWEPGTPTSTDDPRDFAKSFLIGSY